MFNLMRRSSRWLAVAGLALLGAGSCLAQPADRQGAAVSGGHAASGGRSASPAPASVHAVPSGPSHASASGRVATPASSSQSSPHYSGGGYYDPGYYYGYYNPYYRYGLCGSFYGLLYYRYAGLYPGLFRSIPSDRDLYLTGDSVKAALRDATYYVGQLSAAYENLKGLSEGTIGANLSPEERKKEVREVVSQIRRLSGRIKDDPFLPMLDQRKDTDVTKTLKLSGDHQAALDELGKLIASLKAELSSFSNSPNVVSVKSYTAPSVRSLAKGIDKVAKRLS